MDVIGLNLAKNYTDKVVAEAQLSGGGGEVDLSIYATKDEVNKKADTTHSHSLSDISDYREPDLSEYATKGELFSGSYNDLSDKPEIPSTDGLVSEESLNTTLSEYAKTSQLPNEYDDTELSSRVETIETNLGGYLRAILSLMHVDQLRHHI